MGKMKLYCAWHKKYYPDEVDSNGDFYIGEKEPFDNTRRTDGLCKKCEEKLAEEINVIRGTAQRNRLNNFINRKMKARLRQRLRRV